jgi:hypothetical protein
MQETIQGPNCSGVKPHLVCFGGLYGALEPPPEPPEPPLEPPDDDEVD